MLMHQLVAFHVLIFATGGAGACRVIGIWWATALPASVSMWSLRPKQRRVDVWDGRALIVSLSALASRIDAQQYCGKVSDIGTPTAGGDKPISDCLF